MEADLSIFDYIVIAVVTLTTAYGFFMGFVWCVLSFFIWYGSAIISLFIAPLVEPLMEGSIENIIVRYGVSWLLTYCLTIIIIAVIAIPARKMAVKIIDGPVDTALGFTFGLVKGTLIITTVFLVIIFSHGFLYSDNIDDIQKMEKESAPEWIASSQTYGILRFISQSLFVLVPDKFMEDILEYHEENQRDVEQGVKDAEKLIKEESPEIRLEYE